MYMCMFVYMYIYIYAYAFVFVTVCLCIRYTHKHKHAHVQVQGSRRHTMTYCKPLILRRQAPCRDWPTANITKVAKAVWIDRRLMNSQAPTPKGFGFAIDPENPTPHHPELNLPSLPPAAPMQNDKPSAEARSPKHLNLTRQSTNPTPCPATMGKTICPTL